MLRIKRKQKSDCEEEIRTKSCSKEFLEDIMRLILPRLCKSDYLSCRVVCHSWRAAVDKAIASKNCPPASRLPWLISIDSSQRFQAKDHCFVNQKPLYKSMGKLDRLIGFVSFSRRKFVGSIVGWLIMVEHRAVYFLNPISGARVMLPSRSTIHHTSFSFMKAVASTVPTRLQHCLVASLSKKHRLAFCKPKDKSWTVIEVEGREDDELVKFGDIEIIDERLYAATDLASESLMVFHISYADGGPPTYSAERLVMNHPRPVRNEIFEDIIPPPGDNGVPEFTYTGATSPYLAKDSASKELFMIFRNIRVSLKPATCFDMTAKSCETQGFRVFKLEGNIVNGRPRWVEIVDLGDRILFVSRLSNKFVSSGNGPSSCSDNKEFERNCIYYAFSWPSVFFLHEYEVRALKKFRDFGVYSLTNRSIHALPKHHARSLHRQLAWFTPNPNLW
uniref:uncharacterized protein LOC101300558 n=1 Tax=Fragaria vesca subsp. vesca TaxID=101020 RepID=UPI0005CA3A39|nr:PREDICTED: uncharacterized protein LOC101300558 [Fragaria vesca subsp. vesca]